MRLCRESAMSCAAARTASAGVNFGLDMYSCFKNTIPDILVDLVFLTHRNQKR